MRCIADGAERSGGEVRIGGTEIRKLAPYDCVALGIGRKVQTATVFESLTVGEALRIARYRIAPPSAGAVAPRWSCRSRRWMSCA
jgi:branched-chain amino acid transport system permease protein